MQRDSVQDLREDDRHDRGLRLRYRYRTGKTRVETLREFQRELRDCRQSVALDGTVRQLFLRVVAQARFSAQRPGSIRTGSLRWKYGDRPKHRPNSWLQAASSPIG